MTDIAFRIFAEEDIVSEIKRMTDDLNVELSEPQPIGSASEPLNAPITGHELTIAVQVITAIFTMGTSALIFFEKLSNLLEKRKKTISIALSQTNKKITLTGHSGLDEIEELLKNV